MAQPHCDKHKRYVPYCDDCKAIVAAAEEAALQAERDALAENPEAEEEDARAKQAVLEDAIREEESKALAEGIGFPGAPELVEVPETGEPAEGDEESPASSPPADDVGEGPHVGFTPTPPEVQPTVAGEGETEEAMAEDGEFDLPTQPGYIGPPLPPSITLGPTTDAAARVLEEIADALDRGEEVTVLFGNAEQSLRQEGRKEVIGWVKEWFADSQDTGAHQLLEYLAKRSK